MASEISRFTPRDFFLWGYLEDKVFRTPTEKLNVLQKRIIIECSLLRANRDLIIRSAQHMRSRSDTCLQRGRGYLEGNL